MPITHLSIRLTVGLLSVGLLAGCSFDDPPPTRVLGGSDLMVMTRGDQEEGRQLAVDACRQTDQTAEVELIATDPTGDICRSLGQPWPRSPEDPPWVIGEPCKVGDVNEEQTGGPGVWSPNTLWQCR